MLEALDVLAALTRVRPAAEAVHRDCQCLVRLGGDRAVAHRAGGEPLDDLAGRLDLVERNRRAHAVAELQQPAQRRHPLALVVDQCGVLLEDRVLPGAGGVLQLEHRVRVEQVVLALAAPLVLTADLEFAVRPLVGPVQVRQGVPAGDIVGDVVEVDAADGTRQPGEVLVEQLLADADGLEQLRTGVGRQRRDAHLGHHLQHALARGLDVVGLGLVAADAGDHAAVAHVLDRLERHVRVDRGGTETDKAGHMVHLAGVARLDHEPDLGPGAVAHQVVVHGRDAQQRRDRRHRLVGLTVGQHNDACAVPDRLRHLGPDVVERLPQPLPAAVHRIQAANHRGAHPMLVAADLVIGVDAHQLRQFGIAQDGVRKHDLPTRLGVRVEQVTLGADGACQAGHHLFANRVQGRVGDLGEQLLEVVVEHPRPLRQHGNGGVGAHRTERLGAGPGHRRNQQVELLIGVAEDLLAQHNPVMRHAHVVAGGKLVEVEQAGVQPLLIGELGGEFGL